MQDEQVLRPGLLKAIEVVKEVKASYRVDPKARRRFDIFDLQRCFNAGLTMAIEDIEASAGLRDPWSPDLARASAGVDAEGGGRRGVVSNQQVTRAFNIYSEKVGLEGVSGYMAALCSSGLRAVLEDATHPQAAPSAAPSRGEEIR